MNYNKRYVVESVKRPGSGGDHIYRVFTMSQLESAWDEADSLHDDADYFAFPEWAIQEAFSVVFKNEKCIQVTSANEFKKEFIENIRRERVISDVVNRLGNLKLIIKIGFFDLEYDQHRTSVSRSTVREIATDIYGSIIGFNNRFLKFRTDEVDRLNKINSIKELGQEFEGCQDDALVFFGTEEEYNAHKVEQRRKELEATASEVAHAHNVKINSLEFLNVVEKLIADVDYEQERWNDGEIRMEEWAAHMHAGRGAETYFDDLNFENGRYENRRDQLEGILEWVSQNCPLLWAQYEEMKLSAQEEMEEEVA